jgi:hypothetical protein
MNTQITSIRPRITSGDLAAKITEHIQQLAQATDAARVTEEMHRYLDACSKFHHYNLQNIWLILIAKPHATRVAGFRKWQSLSRYVRKGEHGIPILAPVVVIQDKDKPDEGKVVVGFKVVYVFDISQTEGEPLPPPPEWKSPEKNTLLAERLVEFAKRKGITVTERQLVGDIQGVSKGGLIELNPAAGTSTLIHEIAHELMHRNKDRPTTKSIREMEAEAVAFVVARHFGMDNMASPNYVALHGADSKAILEHLERICRLAAEVIEAVDV